MKKLFTIVLAIMFTTVLTVSATDNKTHQKSKCSSYSNCHGMTKESKKYHNKHKKLMKRLYKQKLRGN